MIVMVIIMLIINPPISPWEFFFPFVGSCSWFDVRSKVRHVVREQICDIGRHKINWFELIRVSRPQNLPTCHQQLDAALLRHLLRRVAGDEVEDVGPAVRRPHVRDPQGAVVGPRLPQVLHPVLVGRVWEDAGAVEDVAETDRRT